jgi:uncharacterized protein YecE (DUF72 family)
MPGRVWIGPSGYAYPEWRGRFYPPGLPPRLYLAHLARSFPTVELNGTFYSLKSPALFRRWADTVPPGFLFAVKGSRFITHARALAGVEGALAAFYASGVLELGDKTGPFLWQLPPSLPFDGERARAFLDLLPRSAAHAAALAGIEGSHADDHPLRHALEVRHPSWITPALFRLLEDRGCALVLADSAGCFPAVEQLTADFVYVRLHGSTRLYESGYTDAELDAWADRIERWAGPPRGLDVYVYFDNTALGHAPEDARSLAERVAARGLGIAPRGGPEQGVFVGPGW